MRDELTLSFDCGTQSVRSLLFDQSGTLLHVTKHAFEHPYFSRVSGWAEQEPAYWWECLCRSCQKMRDEIVPELFDRITSVSITSMRDTYLCLDEERKPLRPAILWLDQRSAKCTESLGFIPEVAFRLVGMRQAVQETRVGTKSNWIREEEPDVWKKTAFYASLAAWFNYRLTGKLVDSIGNQVGHIPFNYQRGRWLKKGELKWGISPIENEKLTPLFPSGTVIGTVSEIGSKETGLKVGTKVVATGTDKGCETLGSGCISPDSASLSFGTTSTVQLTLPSYVEPQQFLPAYPAVMPGWFNPEVEIFRGYWMITWFIEQFGGTWKADAEKRGISIEQLLNEGLDTVPPGSEGLLLQPYWGPGLKYPEAKGAILGFSDYHGRNHLYRAIIEGINYGLMEGLAVVEKRAGTHVVRLTANGGGAKSPRICQITADMFGLPVTVCQTTETSGLGSAISSFVAMGCFKNYEEAVQRMVHPQRTSEPDEKNHRLYERLFKEEYLPLYHHLKPLYKKMRTIMEEQR